MVSKTATESNERQREYTTVNEMFAKAVEETMTGDKKRMEE